MLPCVMWLKAIVTDAWKKTDIHIKALSKIPVFSWKQSDSVWTSNLEGWVSALQRNTVG